MKPRRLIRLFILSTLTSAWLLSAAAVVAQPVNTGAERLFETGFEQFQNNVFANAIDTFNELRRTYPDHPRSMDAMYFTAEAQLALGRDEEAIRILDQFDASWPTHPFAFGTRLALGKFYFDRGEWSRANSVLESVLERSPGPESSALALYWMAESRIRMNEPDAAIRTFRRIVDEYPETPAAPRAAYAIAVAQVNQARYDDAARSFEDLASRWPNSEYARNVGLALAEVYYELDDFGRAADEIRRQLPYLDGAARDRARFLLAESFNQLRQHDDAIVEYRYFTEGDPANPYYRRALFGLAWNYHHQESWQWAADTFRLVHESGADDLAAESMYYEAVNRRMAREDAEAVRIFESYVTNWPDHGMVDHGWHELGVLQYQRRNWAESRDALSVFMNNFTESDIRGDALMHLGNAHIALGDFDPALQAFDQAITLDAAPASLREDIRFQKAWLLYRNRNYREASEQFLSLFESNSTSPQAAEALFWAAESFFQVDNFGRAETLFERYLNGYPGGRHVDATHYALGWTYFRQGRYTEAIPEFQRFLNAYRETSETVPYRSDARLRLADSYFALKRYAEAVRVYGQLAAEGDDYALYQIGQAYSNAGDAFESISTFRQLLSDYPNSEWQEESRYQLGYLYFLGQEYELAISTWEGLIADFPRDPLAAKAQYGIGDAWFNAGETEAAVRAYQQVLTGYPGSPFTADAAAGIQFALMADGQDRRADTIVDSLASALAGTPAADQLRFRQAEAKYQSGRSGAAARDFAAFVSSDAAPVLKAEAWYYLGMIARDDARPAEAIDAFRQVLQAPATANRRAQAARELGHLELEAGNAEAALSSFQTVERAAEGNARLVAEARFGQSLALTQLGRDAEARRLLEDVVEQNGSSPDAHPALLGLARLYLGEGNTDAAVPLLNQLAAEAQDETGAEALYLLGQEYLLRTNPRQAIETLGRMAALFPGYPEWMAKSLMAQGQAFESLGEAGQALQLYNELVSTYPDATEAAAARARIAALEN